MYISYVDVSRPFCPKPPMIYTLGSSLALSSCCRIIFCLLLIDSQHIFLPFLSTSSLLIFPSFFFLFFSFLFFFPCVLFSVPVVLYQSWALLAKALEWICELSVNQMQHNLFTTLMTVLLYWSIKMPLKCFSSSSPPLYKPPKPVFLPYV